MKSSVICIVMVLLLASLSPATVAQGSARAVWQRLNTNVSKVKTFFQPTSDKLLPWRKGVAGALLGTLIYAGALLPYAAAVPEAVPLPTELLLPEKIQNPRSAAMVMVEQSDGTQMLMLVHKSKDRENFVTNPATIREFSRFLADFVDSTKDIEAKAQVDRVLQYWDEHFGVRGQALLAAVDAVYAAKEQLRQLTRYFNGVDAVRAAKERAGYILSASKEDVSKEMRALEQQLASLQLEELTASLNAALKVEDVSNSRDRAIESGIMRAYRNSGYIRVVSDADGQATIGDPSKLYNYLTINSSSRTRLAYKTTDEAKAAREPEMMSLDLQSYYRDVRRGDYNIIMERATVYGHLGFVSTLLVHGYNTNLDKYMQIALKIGHTEIAEAILARTKVNAQINLNAALKTAASNRNTEIAMRLHEAGADVNSGLVGAARGGDIELAKYFMSAGATDVNRALRDAVLYGDDDADGSLYVATYLAAVMLDRIDLNAALKLAAEYDAIEGGYTDWIEHLIRLGADNFNEALLAFAEEASSVSSFKGAKLLIARANNLDHALSVLLESETAITSEFTMYLEDYVRLLIRSGAGIEEGLLTLNERPSRANEEKALQRIFAEETGLVSFYNFQE